MEPWNEAREYCFRDFILVVSYNRVLINNHHVHAYSNLQIGEFFGYSMIATDLDGDE